MSKNYYSILQVDPAAEPEVIEAAYKRLARKYHPDLNKSSEATARMQDLNEAYATLSDPLKRAAYDLQAKEAADSKPHISLDPPFMDFGTIVAGKIATKSFQILNSGGSVSSVHVDWEDKPSWGELSIEPNTGLDPFPVKVTIRVLINSTIKGSLSTSILTIIDGTIYTIPVSLTVTPRVVPKQIRTTTPTPKPVRHTYASSPSPSSPNITQGIITFVVIGIVLLGILKYLAVSGLLPTLPDWTVSRINEGYLSQDNCTPYIDSNDGTPAQCQYGVYRIKFKEKFLFEAKKGAYCTTWSLFTNPNGNAFDSILLSPPRDTLDVVCIESLLINNNWRPTNKDAWNISLSSPRLYSFRETGLTIR